MNIIKNTIKKLTTILLKTIQKIILTFALIIVYYLFIGLTRLSFWIFNPTILKGISPHLESFWLDVKEEVVTPMEYRRQS